MSSDSPESVQHAVYVLLYRAILSVLAWFISWETEWRSFGINLVKAVVSNCGPFIVASCFLTLVLRSFFITLVGVLASVKR